MRLKIRLELLGLGRKITQLRVHINKMALLLINRRQGILEIESRKFSGSFYL